MHALDEPFPAHFAAEGPLTRVGAQVLAQVGVLPEALAAYLAREGALAGVNALVERNARGGHKLLATDGTLVGFRPLGGRTPRPAGAPGAATQSVEAQIGGRIELLPTTGALLTSS